MTRFFSGLNLWDRPLHFWSARLHSSRRSASVAAEVDPAVGCKRQLSIGRLVTRRIRFRSRSRIGQRGAAMLEFAIVATPFFFLLFGVIELGLLFVTNLCLSNGTLQLARQVRVGQIVLPGSSVTNPKGTQMSLSAFKAAICNGVPVLSAAICLSQLQVDVRTQSSFSSQAAPNPLSGQSFSSAGFCFYSGAPGNIVTMRVYLVWPIATPGILSGFANATSATTSGGTSSGSYVVLTSNEVFKNEPNASSTNTGNGC